MIRIAIIEDNAQDQEKLVGALNEFSVKESQEFVIRTFLSAEAYLGAYPRQEYDLLFIDVELPGMTGMELAEKVRSTNKEIIIIFCTNMASLAIKGYDYDAMDYFVKPVTFADIALRMRKVVKRFSLPQTSITISIDGGFKVIPIHEIRYVESFGHDITYHTKDGDFITRERKSMKIIEKELEPFHFARANVSYLVNLRYVSEINGENVILEKESLPLSRNKKKEFVDAFFDYLKRKNENL